MSVVEVVGAQCIQCGKLRGKKANPWRNCTDCKNVVCLRCSPSHNQEPRCNKCWRINWDKEYQEKLKTPVICQKCKVERPTSEMTCTINPKTCKECDQKERDEREAASRAKAAAKILASELAEKNWVPGTTRQVEVNGYSYLTNLPVKVGTKVLLPPTWVDKIRGNNEPFEGTVTSLAGDYEGECSWIIKIIDGANEESARIRKLKEIKKLVDQFLERDDVPDNWHIQLIELLAKFKDD